MRRRVLLAVLCVLLCVPTVAWAAIAATFKTSIHTTTNATSYTTTTGAFTPAANSLILVFIVVRGGAEEAPSSVTGNGATASEIQAVTGGTGGTPTYVAMWAADSGGSPSSGEWTASGWGSNRTGCSIMVVEVTGADLSGGVAASIVQTPTVGPLTGTSGSITLAAAGASDNRPFSMWAHAASEVTNPRTNWTELDDGNFGAPNTGSECQWRSDTFETTASASWAGNIGYIGIAAEVKAAGAAATIDFYKRRILRY